MDSNSIAHNWRAYSCYAHPTLDYDKLIAGPIVDEADARLISAAPDMYELLKVIAEMKVMPVSYIELAKNIVAKAEGK